MEEYAGFWRRVLASFIDTLLFALVGGFIHFIIFGGESINVIPVNAGAANAGVGDGLSLQTVSSTNWFEQGIIALVTVFMWVKFLGTPGKLILGCHVVDAKTGQAINLGQAVLRYVSYLVSFIPLALGIFWIAWDKRKQGFHDKIAGTVVIVDTASKRSDYTDSNDESQKTLQQLMAELK